MLESVLVANRGEIARRVIRTARTMSIRAVAVYSDADADLPYVREADEAAYIGPSQPARSYLDAAALIEAARKSNAAAVHPGYGFLAENADFARQVIEAGLTWVGPGPEAIEQMGDKIRARNLMEQAGVPVSPGTREPVHRRSRRGHRGRTDRVSRSMVKAAGGGGGIGMGAAADEAGLLAAFETARSRAERFFGSPAILLERYVERARHVEVQILGLADGRVLALGERDCSVQRRHQKVAEETPSPGVSRRACASGCSPPRCKAGEAVGYRGRRDRRVPGGRRRGLVRLPRDEHPAPGGAPRHRTGHRHRPGRAAVPHRRGEPPSFDPVAISPHGHALELRIYAEDPVRFLPGPGTITEWDEPTGDGVRVDAGYQAGNTVTPFYDPLLAKLCVHGADRAQALERRAAGGGRLPHRRARRPTWRSTRTCSPARSSSAGTTIRPW